MSNSNYAQYSPYAIAQANAFGVPADLFLWQIGRESSWNPNAYNDTPTRYGNAQGIAQFVPPTARTYGVDVTDPYSSIRGAAQYMRDLYDRALRRGTEPGTEGWLAALRNYGTTAGNLTLETAARNILGASAPGTTSPNQPSGFWDNLWGRLFNPFPVSPTPEGFTPGAIRDNTITDNPFVNAASGFIERWLSRGVLVILGIGLVFIALIWFSPAKEVVTDAVSKKG